MAGGDELSEIQIHYQAQHLMTEHSETKIYVLEVELKMDASDILK